MIDEEMDQNNDFFSDGDLADAENLPLNQRYIGFVSKVDVSQSLPGAFRKMPKPLKDGREEVPQIDVAITAVAPVGGAFDPDSNYYRTSTMNFWIGKEDRIGRHTLSRLIRDAAGISEEDLKTMPIRDAAQKLEKVYLTFDVKYRKFQGRNGEGTAQDFIKVKPATVEEIEAVQ